MKIFRYLLGAIMVNSYLVCDENGKGFILDPGAYSREMTDKIAEEKIDIEWIILTHGHGDHIGGVEELKKLYPSAKILASSAERIILEHPENNSSIEICGRPIAITCDKYVADGDTLTIGELELKFILTPGHTPGGLCVLIDNYLFSGDTLFRTSIGRTDFYGGSFPEIINSIKEKLFTLPDDTLVLPGHMDETTIAFEKENNPFVR